MRARSMLGLAAAGCLAAANVPAADNASVGQDLKATIALNGFPCDEVVDSKRNADSDYTATCKDGHRYRVYVDASGRVVVQRL